MKKLTSLALMLAIGITGTLTLTACGNEDKTAETTKETISSSNETENTSTTHQVKMLDMGANDESMVFEPPYIHAKKGDTIEFVASDPTHHVQSKLIPEGAQPFTSREAESFSITLDKEGVYLYVCPPHQAMNMVGIIQVGKATNMEAVNAELTKLKEKVMINKGRWDEYAQQIQQ